MARIDNLQNFLTDVAKSIKDKRQYSEETKIPAAEFDTEISEITTGVMTQEEYDTCLDLADYIMYGGEQPLPYTELEYIESTGTQWIDTGVMGDSNKKIIFDCSTTGTPSGNVFGAWSQNNCLMAEYLLNKVIVYYNITNNNLSYSPCEANTRYKYDISNSLVNVTRGDGTVLINKSQSGSFNTSTTIYLFARHINRSGDNKPDGISPIKFYSCQIWDGSILIRDYIPVTRKSDSKVCIYDKVSETFFENRGTGEFVAGPIK